MNLEKLTRTLRSDLRELEFDRPVSHVYNPLDYAWSVHAEYLRRYGAGTREVVLLGMNPGPWGMVQTGIPFGDVVMVREWMGIEGKIGKPEVEHPRRPVQGFSCRRREISGRRLWGWARETFGPPERFFRRFFVINYCPLCFFEESGKNLTPDKLPAELRGMLFSACDKALRRAVECLQPACVVGIGRFAERRAREALGDMEIMIGAAPHPSGANPQANRNWAALMTASLEGIGLRLD